MLEHGFLVLARGAAEVAEEAAAGHHHLVRRVFLFVSFALSARAGHLVRNIRLGLSSASCKEIIQTTRQNHDIYQCATCKPAC